MGCGAVEFEGMDSSCDTTDSRAIASSCGISGIAGAGGATAIFGILVLGLFCRESFGFAALSLALRREVLDGLRLISLSMESVLSVTSCKMASW